MSGKPEIYVSTDIEADGPIPGPNSMLSFASVAMTSAGETIGTFEANLETLPYANPDPKTMAWWNGSVENKAAYNYATTNPKNPTVVMTEYACWLDGLPGRPVFVGYPATYDFLFIYWYLIRFTGGSPFSFSGLDIKTYAMAMLKKQYRGSTKRNMPKRWFKWVPKHTHKAIDDAIGQGILFHNMRTENEVCYVKEEPGDTR